MNSKLQLGYIFPNLFTAAGAFLGVISILASANSQYEKAAVFIIFALIFDGLDGRIARLTNTTSKFGVEFDSLADIISFGVAPSVLFYFSIGHSYGKFGSLLAAIYVVFGAIRLARFNVTSGLNEPSMFIGLPIPTAAVFVVFWILMWNEYKVIAGYEIYMLFALGILSLLMVSNIRYPSFKKIDLKKAHLVRVLVYLSIVFSMLYIFPVESTTLIVSSYVLYGIIRAFYNIIKLKFKL